MNKDLVKKVKSRGYWQFVFHPVEFQERRLKKSECYDAVQRNNVTLRGWDYPHVEPVRRGDGKGNAEMFDDGFESWTDWADAIEFWKYYRSGQFVHFRALREDWPEEHDKILHGFTRELATKMGATYDEPAIRETPFPTHPRLEVVSAIYEITEVVEFWRKMVSDLPDIYSGGLVATIGLGNSLNRRLFDSDFFAGGSLGQPSPSQEVEISKTFSASDIVADSLNQTIELITEFFDEFGYVRNTEKLTNEVERYLAGNSR